MNFLDTVGPLGTITSAVTARRDVCMPKMTCVGICMLHACTCKNAIGGVTAPLNPGVRSAVKKFQALFPLIALVLRRKAWRQGLAEGLATGSSSVGGVSSSVGGVATCMHWCTFGKRQQAYHRLHTLTRLVSLNRSAGLHASRHREGHACSHGMTTPVELSRRCSQSKAMGIIRRNAVRMWR